MIDDAFTIEVECIPRSVEPGSAWLQNLTYGLPHHKNKVAEDFDHQFFSNQNTSLFLLTISVNKRPEEMITHMKVTMLEAF